MSSAPDSLAGRGRRLPRAVKMALLAVGGLILVPVIALPIIAWGFDLGGVVRKQVLALKPGWEQQIGRSLEIGAVSVRLFPTIAVDIQEVVVAPEAERAKAGGPSAEPLFRLGQARVAIAAWPLLTSLGKDVRISGIELARPVVHVVRFADGRLSYQDIVERLGSEDKPPSEPMSPETLEYVNGVRRGRAAITGAQIAFHDLEGEGGGAPATNYSIDQLDVVATDVQLGKAFPVDVDAALLAPGRNFHLGVRVAPVPRDLVLGPASSLVERVELKLAQLQVEPLLRFLPPPAGLALRRALVEADLSVELPASAGKVKLKGQIGARQLVLAAPGRTVGGKPLPPAIGQPTDVALKTDLSYELVAGDLDAPLLDVAIGEMGIGGKAEVHGINQSPEVRVLDLKSRGVTFERIAQVLPDGTLPQGAKLSGPIELRAAATGSAQDAAVVASLDLDGASLMLPSLHKPAGTALRADFEGHVKPAVIDIKKLALVLGALSVVVHGTATPSADFDLTLDSVRASIDPLVRLLPGVAAAIPQGTQVAGELSLGGRVKKSGKALDGDVRIGLGGAAVKTPALELLGSAAASAKLRAAGGSSAIDATLDLGGARVLLPGTMDKGAGVPMRIVLGADQAGDKLTVREAKVDAPGTEVKASGFTDKRAHRMQLTLSRCAIDLAKLSTVMPMLRNKETLPPWLADGQISLIGGVVGDPAHLEGAQLSVDNLDLAVASGHIRGNLAVQGLTAPKVVNFVLSASGIDFDRILGTQPASDGPPPKSDGQPVVPKIVKTLKLDGRILVDRGTVKGVAFSNFDGKVKLEGGRGRFDTLKLDMFEGRILADGSTVDLNPNPPRFTLKTRFQNIHIGKLIAFQSPAVGNRFDGHGSLEVNLDGQGLSWAQIAPQLAGQVGMAFADGKLKINSIGGQALGQIFQKVPGLGLGAAAPALSGDDISLRNLSTSIRVTDGQLRTTAPLSLTTQKGKLDVAGGIGLDGKLALTGNIGIPADVIAQLTQGRVRLDGPLPVSLKLGGTLLSPDVQVIDLVKTAAVIGQSLLKNQGQAVLQQALGKQLGDKVGGAAGQVIGAGSVDAAAAEAKKQLELEAQKRLQEEQAKLQAQLAEKLKQQAAAQAAQDAQKRLEEEAKKRLGKGLGGLFGR